MAIEVYFPFEHAVFEINVLFPFPLVTAKWKGDYFEIRRCGANCSEHQYIPALYVNKDMFYPQIKLRWDHPCAIKLAHRSLPAQMAMRIKFSMQIINHIWFRGFFSCSGHVSIYTLNIRCANKLARCKYENLVWSASPNCKLIAYSFCWSEQKRKYVLHWQMACSKWKWTSIAMVPDLCPTAVKILTPLISRYHLPLKH